MATDFKTQRARNRSNGGGARRTLSDLERTRISGYSFNAYHNFILHQVLEEEGLESYAEAARRLIEREGERLGMSEREFQQREDAMDYVAGYKRPLKREQKDEEIDG